MKTKIYRRSSDGRVRLLDHLSYARPELRPQLPYAGLGKRSQATLKANLEKTYAGRRIDGVHARVADWAKTVA